MDRKLINPQIVTDIANAIRAKKGTTGTINVSQLANEIATISGGGVADSTKTLIGVISGVTPTDELSTNNAIAKGATDTPSEETFTERTTAEGGSIKDTIAFVDKVKGNCIKYCQLANVTERTTTTNGVTFVSESNGRIVVNGTATANATFNINRVDNLTQIGHKYLVCGGASGGSYSTWFLRYDSNGGTSGYDMGSGAIFTRAEEGVTYLSIRVWSGATANNLVFVPHLFDLTAMGCDNLTTADQVAKYLGYESANKLPYLAYQSDTIVLTNRRNLVSSKDSNNIVLDTLPINARNLVDSQGSTIFPNGMLSAGSVCDSWDMSQGVAVKKINVVDLNSLSWFASGTNTSGVYRWATNDLSSVIKAVDNTIVANIIADGYVANTANRTYTAVECIAVSSAGTLFIYDSRFTANTSKDSFVSSLQDKKAYIELATPITYNVTKAKAYYKVSQNGKEVASSTDNSAPLKADIAYRGLSAEDVINAING